jgi:hypothetical protein
MLWLKLLEISRRNGMRKRLDKTRRPVKKGAEDLYAENIALAKEAEKSGNIVLSQTFYQKAEYCLHIMKESAEPVIGSSIYPSDKTSLSREIPAFEKILQKYRNRKAFRNSPPDEQVGAQDECTILPFKDK